MIRRVLELLEEKGISEYKISKDLSLPNSSFSQWKSGRAKPSLDALSKIADYFGVTVDYLMGREQPSVKPPATTGISIARGGEVRTYEIDEEHLKYLELLAEKMEKENKGKK